MSFPRVVVDNYVFGRRETWEASARPVSVIPVVESLSRAQGHETGNYDERYDDGDQ